MCDYIFNCVKLLETKRANTYDWKVSDSGSLYKIFTEKKTWNEAQVNFYYLFLLFIIFLSLEYLQKIWGAIGHC